MTMADTPNDAPPASASAANNTPARHGNLVSVSDEDLSNQSREFLVARVQALERQLKVRNADCAALLKERQTLVPLQSKCDSQKEMILALREQLDVLRVERDSALDAVSLHERAARDAEHQALKHALRMPPHSASGSASVVAATGTGRGARVINTSHAGTQIIYDSSDISSLGFQNGGAAPCDFLGGMGAYQGRGRGTAQAASTAGAEPLPLADDSDDAALQQVIRRAKDEADLQSQQAQAEAQEEARLRARLEALRRSSK